MAGNQAKEGMLADLRRARASGAFPIFASCIRPIPVDEQKNLKKQGLHALEFRQDLSAEETITLSLWDGYWGELPVLFTSRSIAEGGKDSRSEDQREKSLAAATSLFQGVDIEMSMDEKVVKRVVERARENDCMALLSYHDYSGNLRRQDLDDILAKGVAFGADAIKVAAQADSQDVFDMLREFQIAHAGQDLATLAMGKYGAKSRALFPRLGSLFTFASIGEKTAEGQMSLEETLMQIKSLKL